MRTLIALSSTLALWTGGAADLAPAAAPPSSNLAVQTTPLLVPAPNDVPAVLESATTTNVTQEADAVANPYQIIVTRNPFGLKAPDPGPSAEDLAAAQQVVPSELKLTGITTLVGGKRAMFVLQPPSRTNIFSGPIVEGDWDTVITNLQVVSIDEKIGAVKVIYGGKELVLDFAKNGLAPQVGPAPTPASAPGQPGGKPGVVTAGVQTANPALAAAPQLASPPPMMPDTGIRQIPPRISRRNAAQSATDGAPDFTPAQQVQIFQESERVARELGVPLPPSPPIGGNQPQAHQDPPQLPGNGPNPPPRSHNPPGIGSDE